MPAIKRVDKIRTGLSLAVTRSAVARMRSWPAATKQWVNDIHSQLNRTRVSSILRPDSTQALQSIVRRAKAARQSICMTGGRHAMGGQQFGTDALLIDMSGMNRVLRLDTERRTVE